MSRETEGHRSSSSYWSKKLSSSVQHESEKKLILANEKLENINKKVKKSRMTMAGISEVVWEGG